ncbi:MAG: hypothetical protein AAB835_02585, partial [Patescibacteria group bacterium]
AWDSSWVRVGDRLPALAGEAPSDLEDAELVVWSMLDEPMTRDDILRSTSSRQAALGPGETLTALVALELRGLIKEEFGAWHRA